jgi:hypothetical protein
LERARILLCDSRDVVFQGNPFAVSWPALWTCEEDKLLGDCRLNSAWLKRFGGEAAFQQAQHCQIVCAGVLGGQVEQIHNYLQHSSELIERLAPWIPLTVGDQGVHNNLVRMHPELGFTVLPNGGRLAANVGYTQPADLVVEQGAVRFRSQPEAPAILHQYDRHPGLAALIQSRWGAAKPTASR